MVYDNHELNHFIKRKVISNIDPVGPNPEGFLPGLEHLDLFWGLVIMYDHDQRRMIRHDLLQKRPSALPGDHARILLQYPDDVVILLSNRR
jgi:hypothetical protein